MSHVGNAIKMLILLKSRKRMKINELARILEVDERTIRTYKNNLETCNIYIESEAGRYGGYYLESDNLLLGLDITNEEYFSLLLLKEKMEESNNPIKKDLIILFEKLNLVYKNKKQNSIDNTPIYTNKYTKGIFHEDIERKKLIDIHAAIIMKNKIKINYFSISSGMNERIVRPYAAYEYKNDLYFVAYCESRNKILDFKLLRIKEYELLEDNFEPDEKFDIKTYLKNCIGNYRDKEIYLKLQIFYPMSQIVKEKIWVENQQISEWENNSIIFEAKIRGYTEIKSWILSMGSFVKVLEPQELIDDIQEEINKIKNIYT